MCCEEILPTYPGYSRLTSQKHNTEQKRRQAIREGFDRLSDIVPGLTGHGRSEALVLKRTVEFMVEKLMERRRLVKECDEKGIDVDEYLRQCVSSLALLSDSPHLGIPKLTIRWQRFAST